MANDKQIEILQNNFLKIEKQEKESLEQAVSNFLEKNFIIEKDQLETATKKIIKNGLIFIDDEGKVSSRYSKDKNIFVSEKFLEKLLRKPKAEIPKHLEDVLKERIENLLKFFSEAIEEDKKSKYKILRDYAISMQKEIASKNELKNEEIAKIMEYLNSRQIFFSNLENAKVFANSDLKSSNKLLAQTANEILKLIDDPNMSLQQAQQISVYVMQRMQYDYVLSSAFSYAEKDLRENPSDKQKVEKAREVLSILSKDQPSQEELFKLADYVNRKEFEGSIKIIEYFLEQEQNEFQKNYLSSLIRNIKENKELTMFDLASLRAYYQSNLNSLLDKANKILSENEDAKIDNSIKEKLQKGGNFSVFELEAVLEFLESYPQEAQTKKPELPSMQTQEILQSQQDPKSQIYSYLESLYKEANDSTDPQKIDQLFLRIDKIETKLKEIENLDDEQEQQKSYKKLLDSIKKSKL